MKKNLSIDSGVIKSLYVASHDLFNIKLQTCLDTGVIELPSHVAASISLVIDWNNSSFQISSTLGFGTNGATSFFTVL